MAVIKSSWLSHSDTVSRDPMVKIDPVYKAMMNYGISVTDALETMDSHQSYRGVKYALDMEPEDIPIALSYANNQEPSASISAYIKTLRIVLQGRLGYASTV